MGEGSGSGEEQKDDATNHKKFLRRHSLGAVE